MEKYGRARQATDDNIIRCITKATDTHSEYVILIAFAGNSGYMTWPQCYICCALPVILVSVLKDRKSSLTLLSLYARVLLIGFMSLRLVTTQQRSRRTTAGRDSRTQRKVGRGGEMPGEDCKGPHQFTVCLITLQLLLYWGTCFLLFDDGMIWSHAYVITTDVSMVTGNCGIFMLNTNIFKHLSIKQIIVICEVLKKWIDDLLFSAILKFLRT